MATTSLVTIEEYLQTSYRPDVEYLDGELRERASLVKHAHGRLQIIIGTWFENHQQEWSVVATAEARTRVSPTRVRLPDLVIDTCGPKPETLTEPPLIVIEILSPGDSYTETQRLAADYQQMSVQNIWLIDPETRTGRVCRGADWIGTRRFEVEGTPIFFDLEFVFRPLDIT